MHPFASLLWNCHEPAQFPTVPLIPPLSTAKSRLHTHHTKVTIFLQNMFSKYPLRKTTHNLYHKENNKKKMSSFNHTQNYECEDTIRGGP